MKRRMSGRFMRILVTFALLCWAVGSALAPSVAYAGATWSTMTSGTTNDLLGAWGSSATDVFAVGYVGTIQHYNGSAWSDMTSGTTNDLYSVWGSSATDVFAVGAGGTILHYNGTSWSAMTSGTTSYLIGVWGRSATDVFAVGGLGTILHYNGTSWSAMTSGTTNLLYGVWGSSPNDVFAVGESGTILHFDGSTWSAISSGTTNYLAGVWGSSGEDVFAIGESGTILHYSVESGTVTCTVDTQLLSLTVTDGSVAYGIVAPGGTKSTLELVPPDTQTVTNTGSMAEKIMVKSSDATSGVTWKLVASSDAERPDEFAHQWSTNSGVAWNDFDPGHAYGTLVSSLAPAGTQTFDLKIHVPTSRTDVGPKSITVTVLATMP